jgi:hypothetical protein
MALLPAPELGGNVKFEKSFCTEVGTQRMINVNPPIELHIYQTRKTQLYATEPILGRTLQMFFLHGESSQ